MTNEERIKLLEAEVEILKLKEAIKNGDMRKITKENFGELGKKEQNKIIMKEMANGKFEISENLEHNYKYVFAPITYFVETKYGEFDIWNSNGVESMGIYFKGQSGIPKFCERLEGEELEEMLDLNKRARSNFRCALREKEEKVNAELTRSELEYILEYRNAERSL